MTISSAMLSDQKEYFTGKRQGMGFGNVSERRSAPPQVGVSVVILALGPDDMPEHGATVTDPLIPFCGCRWSSESVSLSSALGLCPEAT